LLINPKREYHLRKKEVRGRAHSEEARSFSARGPREEKISWGEVVNFSIRKEG
jgi:hypothetical protein